MQGQSARTGRRMIKLTGGLSEAHARPFILRRLEKVNGPCGGGGHQTPTVTNPPDTEWDPD